MKKKIKKLLLIDELWACGHKDGETNILYNPHKIDNQHSMCCLGQFAVQCSVGFDMIESKSVPYIVRNEQEGTSFTEEQESYFNAFTKVQDYEYCAHVSTKVACELIDINDSQNPPEKIAELLNGCLAIEDIELEYRKEGTIQDLQNFNPFEDVD